jgi:hypothetical protein
MVIAMHARLFLLFLAVCLFMLPAYAEDEITSDSGPVEVEPDTEESTVTVPLDEETGTVDWQDYLSLPAGGGANFGFVTVLYPPDPAALADSPEILLDGAWYPPIPLAYGFNPPANGNVSTRGWWYLEDGSGNLARRDMDIDYGSGAFVSSTWFMGGGWVFHIEQDWTSGYFAEQYYLADEWSGPGIEYFLRNVWFHGVLGGDRMSRLLEVCGAERIGRDLINGGHDRLAIFRIPPNETDRQNGRGNLLVWLTIGDWRIVRTRLHAAYAIEVTQFENVSIEVDNDPNVFYSDFLTQDIYWSMDQYLLTHETPFFGMAGSTDTSQPQTFMFAPGQSTESGNADENGTDEGDGAEEEGEGDTEE